MNRFGYFGRKASIFTLCFGLSVNVIANTETAKPNQQAPQLEELPNPVTLPLLLDKFSAQSPVIELYKAQSELAQANLNANQVQNQWQVGIDGRIGFREFAQKDQDHHRLALHVGKVLYDFDRLAAQSDSDNAKLEQQNLLLQASQNRQQLEVVKAYFNVLLADFQYRIDNEAMAIEYVGFDKVKDKHAVGQLSDVDLLAAEQLYQQALVKRMQAEQAQLQTRIELANVIGQPAARPDELKFPDLKNFNKRSVKGIGLEQLQTQVLQQNLQLKALQQAQQAQVHALEKAQNLASPTLRGDAWLGRLSSHPEVREGNWKAELSIDVPLYDGGNSASATLQAKAQLKMAKAQTQQLEQQLRTQVADIYFQLKLLKAEQKQQFIFGDYADLYLDFSRALYENESKTDLGDAMVRLSQANYQMVAWEFKQALLWLELDYLLGNGVDLNKPTVLADSLK